MRKDPGLRHWRLVMDTCAGLSVTARAYFKVKRAVHFVFFRSEDFCQTLCHYQYLLLFLNNLKSISSIIIAIKMRTVHQIIYCEDTAESHAENSFNRAKLYRKYILLPMAIITFIISLLKHIEKCNYEEDGGNIPQRIAENYLSIRNLYTSFYSIKFLSMFLIFVWLS